MDRNTFIQLMHAQAVAKYKVANEEYDSHRMCENDALYYLNAKMVLTEVEFWKTQIDWNKNKG